jgi:hypothetical protein
MDLGRRINAAVYTAAGHVIHAYAVERAGADLPPLTWTLTPSWALWGHAGADCAEDQVAGVLARWAQALGLTQAELGPNMAGSVTYEGTVEGRPVQIWGVTDRDTWEQPTTPPPPGGAS